MSRKFIPVEEAFAEWRKDPEFVAEYDALEEEFTLADALIRARGHADMTQEQVAEKWAPPRPLLRGLKADVSCPPPAP
jgi:hypothetical protein